MRLENEPDSSVEKGGSSTPPSSTTVCKPDPVSTTTPSPATLTADSSTALRPNVTRSSVRVLLRKREEETKESEAEVGEEEVAEEEPKKQKRTWEQWSSEDKSYFFEALNECGKNFDAIEQFVQAKKARKKTPDSGNPQKVKEQIRTFYYRTWHKISKYIDFPTGLKKSCCELYGLINFGELRKKTGSKLNEKTGAKLEELVFKGHTTVRVRGKSYRIKTPMCATLKRLNDTGSDVSTAKTTSLPDKINLILEPANREAFVKVHRQALQNPRLNLTVPLDKRLKSVLEFLSRKWASTDSILCERYKEFASASFLKNFRSPVDNDELWLIPKPGTKLMSPLLKPIEPLTSSTLSLSHMKKTEDSSPEPDEMEVDEEEKKQDLLSGWNSEKCNEMTIGEMFLINGLGNTANASIELTYCWRPKGNQSPEKRVSVLSALSRLTLAELSRRQKPPNSNATTKKSEKSEESSNNEVVKDVPKIAVNGNATSNESNFRRPTIPPVRLSAQNTQQQQAFRQQLDLLIPKYNQRRGRPLMRSKNVVSRQLLANRPLQPKMHPLIKTVDGKVKVRCFPETKSGPTITLTHPVISIEKDPSKLQPLIVPKPLAASSPAHPVLFGTPPQASHGFGPSCLELLDCDEPSKSKVVRSDKVLFDTVVETSNNSMLQTPSIHRPTPPASPYCDDPSCFPEISLNSLLNISSGNRVPSAHLINEDSSQSTGSEVDRHILSMMTESSVDFTSKFAKLANAVTNSDLPTGNND